MALRTLLFASVMLFSVALPAFASGQEDPCADFSERIAELVALMDEPQTPQRVEAFRALGDRLVAQLSPCGHLISDAELGLEISRRLETPWAAGRWAMWTADRTSRADLRAIASLEAAEHLRDAGRPAREHVGRLDQALLLAPLLPESRWERLLPRLARGRWVVLHGGGELIMTPEGPGAATSERLSLFAALSDLIAFAQDHAALERAVAARPELLAIDGPILEGLAMLERFHELEAANADAEIADRAEAARQAAVALQPVLFRLSPQLAFAERPQFRLGAPPSPAGAEPQDASDIRVPAAPSRLGRYLAALGAGVATAIVLILLKRRQVS